jgi:hypothetical protein
MEARETIYSQSDMYAAQEICQEIITPNEVA